jgi:hypothetical protein
MCIFVYQKGDQSRDPTQKVLEDTFERYFEMEDNTRGNAIQQPLTTVGVSPTNLPDLPLYLHAKAELSSIMQDFTDNKIHFIGLDNHVITVAEYQTISRFTETGADPGKFMKGCSRVYKTGYNKETNTFEEGRLFVPNFMAYPAST